MLNVDKVLKEAISRDTLTVSEVDDMLKMTRKKLIEQKHPYVINSRSNGRVLITVREDGKLKAMNKGNKKNKKN